MEDSLACSQGQVKLPDSPGELGPARGGHQINFIPADEVAGSRVDEGTARTHSGREMTGSLPSSPRQLFAGAVSSVQGEPSHACTSLSDALVAPLSWTPRWAAGADSAAKPPGASFHTDPGPRIRLLPTQQSQGSRAQRPRRVASGRRPLRAPWSQDPVLPPRLLQASSTPLVQQAKGCLPPSAGADVGN